MVIYRAATFAKVAGLTCRLAVGAIVAVKASGVATAATRVGELWEVQGRVIAGAVFFIDVRIVRVKGVRIGDRADYYAGGLEPDIFAPAALSRFTAHRVILFTINVIRGRAPITAS